MTLLFCCCWKVSELRRRVDPFTGEAESDRASLGVSQADMAALEWALRCAEAFGGSVRLLAAGGPRADAVLLDGLATGASEALRVELDEDAPSDEVAAALAPHTAGAAVVWCGDASVDRGSGAVPAFLAAGTRARQALGVVAVSLGGGRGRPELSVLRRLDAGRRERLFVMPPAVVSCESSTALLRRAPLPSLVAPRTVTVLPRPAATARKERTVAVAPARPRVRPLEPPHGTALERTAELLALGRRSPVRAQRLAPAEAAAAVLSALTEWGEW